MPIGHPRTPPTPDPEAARARPRQGSPARRKTPATPDRERPAPGQVTDTTPGLGPPRATDPAPATCNPARHSEAMCHNLQAIVVTGGGDGSGSGRSTSHPPHGPGRTDQQPGTGSHRYSSAVSPLSRPRMRDHTYSRLLSSRGPTCRPFTSSDMTGKLTDPDCSPPPSQRVRAMKLTGPPGNHGPDRIAEPCSGSEGWHGAGYTRDDLAWPIVHKRQRRRVRRDFLVLVSPPVRTERQTLMHGGGTRYLPAASARLAPCLAAFEGVGCGLDFGGVCRPANSGENLEQELASCCGDAHP